MNQYVIDPAVFYWMNTLEGIKTACGVIGAFALIGFIVLFCLMLFKLYDLHEPKKPADYEESSYVRRDYENSLRRYQQDLLDAKLLRKYAVITLIVGAVLVLGCVFIPNKTASVEMMVARTATFENVEWSVQQVKEIVDYMIGALKEVV